MIFNTLLHAAYALSGYLWDHIQPFMNTLLNDASDASLKRAAILVSPYICWYREEFRGLAQVWVATASTIPKEEEVAPSVVDVLLQIAHLELLPPENHGDIWSWLKLRPSLPPICHGRKLGGRREVMQQVRGLKDIEILKSYFLVVWSEWDPIQDSGFPMMYECIHEEFSGVEANFHRAELVQRLDRVIRELNKGLAHLQRGKPDLQEWQLQRSKKQYERLRKILKKIREEPEIPTCMSSRLINVFELLTLVEHAQDLTRYPYVRSLSCIHSRSLQCPVLIPPSYTYHSSVQTSARSFIVVRFPFTLLVAPGSLLRLLVVQRAGPFVDRHLSAARCC